MTRTALFLAGGALLPSLLLAGRPGIAQVLPGPASVSFQGRLNQPNGTAVPDGMHAVTISLWDAATGGGQRFVTTLPAVQVANGLFTARLTGLTPGALNGDVWVQLQVDADAPMSPRIPLASAPSALKANTVPDGAVGAVQLAPDPGALAKVSGGAMNALVSGRVGLGAPNPVAKLEIVAGADNNGANDGRDIALSYHGGGYRHWIRSRHNPGPNNGNAIDFFVNSSGAADGSSAPGAGNTEVLTLAGSGNAGIGTESPTERLTVNGRLAFAQAQGDQLDAGKVDYRTFDSNSLSIVGAGTTDSARNVRVFDTLSVGFSAPSNGIAVFNGSVGIGTSVPGSALDVQAGDAADFNHPVASFSGSNRSGTWLKLNNSSDGGHQFALVSTGPDNGEGAGTLLFYDGTALAPRMALTRDGDVGIGTVAPTSELDVNGEVTAKIVTVTGGSDVAEPYTVAPCGGVAPEPGMVVCIEKGQVGTMRVSGKAYDKRVAGILSGANGIAPGITLRQKGGVADGEMPVASIGRVWCWCDATAGGPIEQGDMLTTSNTPGHAMKATDRERATGAVIGKAMSSLSSGKGLVLVLVTLN